MMSGFMSPPYATPNCGIYHDERSTKASHSFFHEFIPRYLASLSQFFHAELIVRFSLSG
jgi:hypothetical protein